VATFADGHALLDSINSINPDVIVADSAIPLLHGLEAGRQLKEKITSIRFVFLTMNEAPELAVEAAKLGTTWVRFEGICALRGASSYSGCASRQILHHTTDCQGMQESFIRDPNGTGNLSHHVGEKSPSFLERESP
jgi:CheY-like chemotaxis protein